MFHLQLGNHPTGWWALQRDKGFNSTMADLTKSLCHRVVSCFRTQSTHRLRDQAAVLTQLPSHRDSHFFTASVLETPPSLSSIFPPDGHCTSALLKLYCLFVPIVLATRPSCSRDLSRSLFNAAPNVTSSANFIVMILCFLPCHW